MLKNQIKIIIDTNLWVSFLISKNYKYLDDLLFSNAVKIIFSIELLEEFLDVVKRPKLRKYFSNNDVEMLIEYIQDYALFIEIKSKVNLCRDKKDDFLLSLAIDSEADYLITGDNDLLEIHHIKKTKIIKINDFFNLQI